MPIVVLMLKLRPSVRKIWLNGLITNSILPLLSVPQMSPLVLILLLKVLLFSLLRLIPDQLRPLKVEMFLVPALTR